MNISKKYVFIIVGALLILVGVIAAVDRTKPWHDSAQVSLPFGGSGISLEKFYMNLMSEGGSSDSLGGPSFAPLNCTLGESSIIYANGSVGCVGDKGIIGGAYTIGTTCSGATVWGVGACVASGVPSCSSGTGTPDLIDGFRSLVFCFR